MDRETKKSVYHTSAFSSVGATLMTFKPIDQVHHHLCAFHTYSQDRSRHVEAHHFCTHLSSDLHQCVIYDSDGPNARLIGIEYIVPDKVFRSLPTEEKKYWHSHKYEVESGLLQLQMKGAVPDILSDTAEQPAMLELQQTYGKTIHTWAIDRTPDLPLGPPNLMMSYTEDGQIDVGLVETRDERLGVSTEDKRQLRASYLPPYERAPGADEWERTGKGIQFIPEDVILMD